AALADYLLGEGSAVTLVGHDFDGRFLEHRRCRVERVARPGGKDLLGVFGLRRHGRAAALRARAAGMRPRVVVNGGGCHWGDVNWVHYVHAGWRPSTRRLGWMARLKEKLAGALFRRQEAQALRAARVIVANSEQTRRTLIDGLQLAPEKVLTVYLGNDTTWQPPTPQERSAARAWLGLDEHRPTVVFVGGFGHDERKGFDTLWQAWRGLRRRPEWDVDLVAAGGGSTLASWQERVCAAGLERRVRLIGFTDRVFDLLAAADMMVSPVRYEPYGLNVQEAVCRGVPAIVSAVAGVAEEYPPELADAILNDPDDPGELAARLRQWKADIA